MTNTENYTNPVKNLNTVIININENSKSVWDNLGKINIIRKKKLEYVNMAVAFDIETTTIPCRKNAKEDFEMLPEYYNETLSDYKYTPLAFMYHWQMGFMNDNNQLCILGRTWEEFLMLREFLINYFNLGVNRKLVVYCHMLQYEFQFIQAFFEWESVFARSERKLMKAVAVDGFEFRCSYFLSNMSLQKFCENTEGVIHGKLGGALDFRLFRTNKTKLTKKEQQYCVHDVLGLCECISAYLNSDTLFSIPLTSTGFVRRMARQKCLEVEGYRQMYLKSFPSAELYQMCRDAFRGGDTHANRIYAGRVISNVYSYDIKSSYPAWMLYEEYPYGAAKEVVIQSNADFFHYRKNYLMVFQVELYDVELRLGKEVAMPYIDLAHIRERSNLEEDNGRILKGDYVLMTITNIDWDIIETQYQFTSYRIRKCYVWNKKKLPLALRNVVVDLFKSKTTLDGIPEKHYEYLKSKNLLNSCFGMMVTALDMDEITYNDLQWGRKKIELKSALTRVKNSSNSFLLYQWGIFITAYARLHLHKVLDRIGYDAIYIDTDSIKFINKANCQFFENENKYIMELMAAEELDTYAYTPSGEKMILGIWEYEGCYPEFKTLGAKKYCMTNLKKKTDNDPDYIITVSGMNKKKGSKQIQSMSDFNIGTVYEDVGRSTSFYNDCHPFYGEIKGEKILFTPNVAVVDTTYTLGLTDTYYDLIMKNLNSIERSKFKYKKKKKKIDTIQNN